MAAYTEDDGFHEIQLNGKQLVFLFMAATVVSVVIFLCGVLVGRGVRADRGELVQTSTEELVPVPHADVAKAAVPPAADPTQVPPPPVDELSYFNRLEKTNPPLETLNKPPEKQSRSSVATPERVEPPARIDAAPPPAAPARPVPPAAAPAKAAAPTAAAAAADKPQASAADTGPSPSGFAVQVAALNVRSEADAMAKRLSSKGYAAYVLASADGKPSVFRVRIGSFKTRREADAIVARLQKEEQIKPWVTR